MSRKRVRRGLQAGLAGLGALLTASGSAQAASCCTATGADPLTLKPGERLVLLAATAIDARQVEVSTSTSAGVLGRLSSWSLVGLRVPVLLDFDGDGVSYGMGHPYGWLRFEGRPWADWLAAWTTGLGSVGPDPDLGPGALRVEAGPTLGWSRAGDAVLLHSIAKAPVQGAGTLDFDTVLTGVVAMPHLQLGGRMTHELSRWQGETSGAVALGPTIWLEGPTHRLQAWADYAPEAMRWGPAPRAPLSVGLNLLAGS